jgi:cytochrome c553
MDKVLRWTGYVVTTLLFAILAAALWLWISSEHILNAHINGRPERLARPTAAQIADAPRQLHVLGCVECHGDGLRGTLMFDEPNIARVYAPNLTLIAAQETDQQLARAIRQGIGSDGRSLVIMPSATFSRLTDSEVAALIRAIHALPRGGLEVPRREIGVLGRFGLAIGQFHTAPESLAQYAQRLPIDVGPQFANGRHLVAIKCAECHGPDLTGSEVEPGVTAPDLVLAGAYDLGQFKALLRTGVPPGARKLTMMDDVARNQFSHYTDEEIAEIHSYLVARSRKLGG